MIYDTVSETVSVTFEMADETLEGNGMRVVRYASNVGMWSGDVTAFVLVISSAVKVYSIVLTHIDTMFILKARSEHRTKESLSKMGADGRHYNDASGRLLPRSFLMAETHMQSPT